ncbi:MAG: S46 family peptidase [Crocinitomicaceae bacterium]|nr:S46 family peptidase [Crocinitomicaceae bacterium]
MKRISLALVFIVASFFHVSAEEGMLIPSLIKAFEDDMQAMGMKLSAEDIYSVNQSSMKDAIMHFGGGCTAELVSDQGLLLTNHHCGYSQIQSHSSLENDYIKYGFWAKTRAEELTNPGLTASRIVRIQDMTASVFAGTEGLSGEAYGQRIEANIAELIAAATDGNHYEANIKAFNYGNEYYMIVQEVFKDVRLVGAPPSSIGKFGGDTDNWVWPRHTGDFSVFRIYAGADNKPAEYSTSNKPYQPLHYFPVSVKDRVAGEFTMIYGFPGTTEQHLSSEHLRYIMDMERPARIAMREQSLGVIDANMRASDLIRIKYASKQARIANGWKKWIGQIGGLQMVDAIQIKLDREKAYNDRAADKTTWQMKYSTVISDMNQLVTDYKGSDFAYSMAVEYMYVGAESFKRAREIEKFIMEYEDLVKLDEAEAEIEKLRKKAKGFFKDYDEETDRKIFIKTTEEYMSRMEGNGLSEILKAQTVEALANEIFSKSVLVNEARFEAFLNSLSDSTVADFTENDPAFKLWTGLSAEFYQGVIPRVREFKGKMNQLLKIYVEGKLEMFPNQKHWADANSTLRITYGKLEGSAPHDGMAYTEHTTLDGIIAKNNTGEADFELLPEFRALAESKDYGGYDQDGELWVCFTGSNHTTGGNSGSPVIDAEGNLMGLNFDRSWESTMSDFMFDADRCRNITVDVRYVLWIMDKYAGATNLVEEMTLVEDKKGWCQRRKEKKAKKKK